MLLFYSDEKAFKIHYICLLHSLYMTPSFVAFVVIVSMLGVMIGIFIDLIKK